MVFHAPYPLAERTAASRLRPVRMRRAFADLGYDVVEVTGYAAHRRRAMARAEQRLDDYERFRRTDASLPPAFVYSENATIPNALTEPRHLPPHPRLDAAFFSRMRRRGLEVGVFYRDLYWRFPRFRQNIPPALDAVLRAAYLTELAQWRRAGLHVYLPSEAMAEHLPVIDAAMTHPLPPGADPLAVHNPSRPALEDGGDLDLLFVGVLGGNYRIEAICRAVEAVEGTSLTLCTRQEEWEQARQTYEPLLPAGRHDVVHASGADLEPLYGRAGLGVLLVQPHEYWDFAVPYKLYEYLAHELPVVATAGTETARIVEELGAGWVIPYDEDALAALLRDLRAHPDRLAAVRKRIRQVLPGQTWLARARRVARDLSGWAPDLPDGSPDDSDDGDDTNDTDDAADINDINDINDTNDPRDPRDAERTQP
ncbi:glycosyltransferase [Actinomyces respiraculi]|uniref:Glycosyltransferase n=2 Tax=Actinomycetaceae TaxID=2049 RepID=A0A7T0LMR4_9ACTO|nr:glycosyltransferase [Actinomyces respiraculi]